MTYCFSCIHCIHEIDIHLRQSNDDYYVKYCFISVLFMKWTICLFKCFGLVKFHHLEEVVPHVIFVQVGEHFEIIACLWSGCPFHEMYTIIYSTLWIRHTLFKINNYYIIWKQLPIHIFYCRTTAKFVKLGDLNVKDNDDDRTSQQFNIQEIIKRPDYSVNSRYNDIALLKLDKPAKLSPFVRPACLQTNSQIGTKKAIATGWGLTSFSGSGSDTLLKVTLEFFTANSCNNTFRREIGSGKLINGIDDESQICAGSHTEEKDTCQVSICRKTHNWTTWTYNCIINCFHSSNKFNIHLVKQQCFILWTLSTNSLNIQDI